MNLTLNEIEARVLGSLIEKEITTPEYYPMTLNALTNACNQKSNREPVMSLSEKDVSAAIDTLRDKKLSWQFSSSGGRVPKYEHNLRSLFTFSKEEVAVICILLLRGPQTVGEIRTRTERLFSFSSLEETEKTVRSLIERDDGPFVTELPRQAGHKENRFTHLFCGMPEASSIYEQSDQTNLAPSITKSDRLQFLEEEVNKLKNEIVELREQFNDFKKQLE
jgi:uncharacterized protein YceH (UPF0502 family)